MKNWATYCPTSEDPDKRHGIYWITEWEDDENRHGICVHCKQQVQCPWWSIGPWELSMHIIQEDPE